MPTTAIISIFCADRTGVVAELASVLFDLGGNLADTTFAVLGTGAEFASICEFDTDVDFGHVEAEIRRVPGLDDAEITVTPFDLSADHGPSAKITHRIIVRGGDRPGLIAGLCEVLGTFGANIVRLNSVREPGASAMEYMVTISVWLPEGKADACLAAVGNTAGDLGLSFKSYKLKH